MRLASPAFAVEVIDSYGIDDLLLTIGPYTYVPPDEPIVYDILDGGRAGTDYGFAVTVDGGEAADNTSIPIDGGSA